MTSDERYQSDRRWWMARAMGILAGDEISDAERAAVDRQIDVLALACERAGLAMPRGEE